MSGTVYGASVHMNAVGGTKGIKFKVFRWNQMTNTTLDLVGESEMITSYTTGSNYFTFANPISGVQEGDLPGFFMTNSATANIVWCNSGNGNSFSAIGDIKGTAQTINTGAGGAAVLQMYMNPHGIWQLRLATQIHGSGHNSSVLITNLQPWAQ